MFANLSSTEIVLFLASLLIAMVFHEVMHGFVAHMLGDTTAKDEGRLTLNPLKHIDLYTTILLPLVLLMVGLPPLLVAKPVPFNPERLKYEEFGTALVGIAGPLTNLLLAVIASLIFRAVHPVLGSLTYEALTIFVWINVGLFIFNLIPIPPLDGSRVLYAVAPEPVQEIMQRIEAFGFITVLAFVLIAYQFFSGPLSNIISNLVGFLLG
ncbi:MAG: site-2 protease family protein [Candidatus Saccharimonadales bacterium]